VARARRPPPGSSSPNAPDDQSSGGAAPAAVVERTLNQTKPGYDEHSFRKRRFDSAYDVWRGNTGASVKQANSWQSRMRVKYGMQVIDQAMVNLVQGVPRAKVTARSPASEPQAKAMEKLLGYYADLDHLAENESLIVQQALIYGISPAKTCWYYRLEDQMQWTPALDPESGQTIWAPQKRQAVTDDRPAMEPWDAYAIWWDPVARSVDSASYIVLQSWKTRDELEQQRYDEDTRGGQYKNLDLLFGSGDPPNQPSSTAQNQMLPRPMGAMRGRFEIWEVWRKTAAGMRQTVIGNRKVLLKDGPGPYWMPGYPITISNSRPDLFRIEGVSESELVDHLQQAMWTVSNLRMEQLKMTVMRGATVRQTAPDIASYVYRPSFMWIVGDHDDVRFQEPPPLPPEAYRETETMLSELQYVTGITPYVSGSSGSAQGIDQNTATGVSLLTESASRLLQFKAKQIHDRTWQRTFEQWAALTKQYLRQPQAVRIEGPDQTVSWQRLGPDEVNGDFDVRIEAGDEAASRAQERSDAVALLNAFAPYVQLGVVDPKILVEKVGQAYGITNPEALLKTQPAQTAAPQPTGAAAGQPPIPPGGPPPPNQLGGSSLAAGSPLGLQPAGNVLNGNR
jgi:hypothetical protein